MKRMDIDNQLGTKSSDELDAACTHCSSTIKQAVFLLQEILHQLKVSNTISESLLQKAISGIRVQEPIIVEVDGIVSVVS